MADALVSADPSAELVKAFEQTGGAGKRKIGEVAMSYDADEATARRHAMQLRYSMAGWKVMAELPTPASFEAASSVLREEDLVEKIACGPDPTKHLDAITPFLEAGFDEICVLQVGADHDGFMRFWEQELRPKLP